jgi:hypothetical protein
MTPGIPEPDDRSRPVPGHPWMEAVQPGQNVEVLQGRAAAPIDR